MPVGFEDARHELILAILARCVTDHAFFIGQLVVEQKGIIPFERLFRHKTSGN